MMILLVATSYLMFIYILLCLAQRLIKINQTSTREVR